MRKEAIAAVYGRLLWFKASSKGSTTVGSRTRRPARARTVQTSNGWIKDRLLFLATPSHRPSGLLTRTHLRLLRPIHPHQARATHTPVLTLPLQITASSTAPPLIDISSLRMPAPLTYAPTPTAPLRRSTSPGPPISSTCVPEPPRLRLSRHSTSRRVPALLYAPGRAARGCKLACTSVGGVLDSVSLGGRSPIRALLRSSALLSFPLSRVSSLRSRRAAVPSHRTRLNPSFLVREKTRPGVCMSTHNQLREGHKTSSLKRCHFGFQVEDNWRTGDWYSALEQLHAFCLSRNVTVALDTFAARPPRSRL